jgi:ribosome recycling factor
MDPNLSEPNQKIQSALDHFKQDLSSVRAGRANPSLIENIPVQAYGAQMKLMEVGTIAAPQPTLLTVQVWDISQINGVVKSIQEANLGLNPSTEGNIIRLPIPPLTEERRQEFIKIVHQKAETAKVQIRQVRQDSRQIWEKAEEASEIGEDELHRREKILQELIDKSVTEVDELVKIKESELMQF